RKKRLASVATRFGPIGTISDADAGGRSVRSRSTSIPWSSAAFGSEGPGGWAIASSLFGGVAGVRDGAGAGALDEPSVEKWAASPLSRRSIRSRIGSRPENELPEEQDCHEHEQRDGRAGLPHRRDRDRPRHPERRGVGAGPLDRESECEGGPS